MEGGRRLPFGTCAGLVCLNPQILCTVFELEGRRQSRGLRAGWGARKVLSRIIRCWTLLEGNRRSRNWKPGQPSRSYPPVSFPGLFFPMRALTLEPLDSTYSNIVWYGTVAMAMAMAMVLVGARWNTLATLQKFLALMSFSPIGAAAGKLLLQRNCELYRTRAPPTCSSLAPPPIASRGCDSALNGRVDICHTTVAWQFSTKSIPSGRRLKANERKHSRFALRQPRNP